MDARFIKKKLDAWRGNSPSSGGRLVLVDASLSSFLLYHMLVNKTFIEIIGKHGRRLF
jgi:hypothetical protein